MLCDGEYRVYLVSFPGDIKAAVRLDEEGFPSIYINAALSPAARALGEAGRVLSSGRQM